MAHDHMPSSPSPGPIPSQAPKPRGETTAVVICPGCASPLPDVSASTDLRGAVGCLGCQRTFPHNLGVLDLRSEPHDSCWSEALHGTEAELVDRMLAAFDDAALADLIDLYVSAHQLPKSLADADRAYMLHAHAREKWTVQYMDFSLQRYAGSESRGDCALDAGCGSGGSLPHLGERFSRVAGLDPDLPALLVALKRCTLLHTAARTTLVAAALEQKVFAPGAFEAIKCTDVLEHVHDPVACCERMAAATAMGGAIFTLTPNKYSVFSPEPHVRLWGVQFMPRRMADAYVQRRIGIKYSSVTRLLSYRGFMKVLREPDETRVVFVPIEDKHLNPATSRGAAIKRAFDAPPLRWLSSAARPIQPSLEAVCIRDAVATEGP